MVILKRAGISNGRNVDMRTEEGLISFGLEEYDKRSYDFVSMLKKSFSTTFGYNGELNKIHQVIQWPNFPESSRNFYEKIPIFGKGDRSSVFIKKFHEAWDSDPKWEELYHNFIREVIQPAMCPGEKEVVIQKTPNIRVGVPGVSNIGRLYTDPCPEIIGLHCDGEHGHPPEEKNIIIPLTQMTSTNSLYFEPYPMSGLTVTEYQNLDTDEGSFFYFYGNGCRHFNKVNDTGLTRMSFDFRIIPFSMYNNEYRSVSLAKKRFKIGDYYTKISCN